MSLPSSDEPGGIAATIGPMLMVAIVGVVGTVAAWAVFVRYPDTLVEFLGVVTVVLVVFPTLWTASKLASSLVSPYDVAEVAVKGPITRDRTGGALSGRPMTPTADDVVDQIERADEDPNAKALFVKNTPGGEIVPSEDVRTAVERFDGPVVGYATDLCASGGYDVASGCDSLRARERTLVGSIGVIGSSVNVHELAERLGVSYEQFVAGEYKDAGTALKEPEEDERAYLQGIVDDYYDQFVETVADGRELDRERIEETEARIYLGDRAAQLDLVDELGDRRAVEAHLEGRLDEPVSVETFEPQRGLGERIQLGSQRVAAAVGAGIGSALGGDVDGLRFRR